MMENGNLNQVKAIDLSYTPSLTETLVLKFLCNYGPQLHGLMLQGKASLAEYFWTNVIQYLTQIRLAFSYCCLHLKIVLLTGYVY